jgi:hypothetical protein
MTECFDSAVRVTQTFLDPRTDTKHVIDFQYERERRTPKPIPSPKNYTEHAADLGRRINTALGLGRVYSASAYLSRADFEDDGA